MIILSTILKKLLGKKSISEPTLAIMHLWKIINIFQKNNLERLAATSLLLESTLLMAKATVTFNTKQKHGKSNKPVPKTADLVIHLYKNY